MLIGDCAGLGRFTLLGSEPVDLGSRSILDRSEFRSKEFKIWPVLELDGLKLSLGLD